MISSVLETKDLSKTFIFRGQTIQILDSINLILLEDEFISIVGASGCGKSTLLELLAGITKPDRGSIWYQGQEITGCSGFLGYMPQSDLLLPWLSVLGNAMLPAKINGRNDKEAKIRALQLAKEFGLENYVNYHPWQLSGGLKQRAAFLRTTMTGAKVLLLDEPFANLDALTRIALQSWLLEIRKKLRLSIVLVTHDLDEAFKLSDRILVMSSSPGRFDVVLSREQDQYQNNEIALKIKDQILQLLV